MFKKEENMKICEAGSRVKDPPVVFRW